MFCGVELRALTPLPDSEPREMTLRCEAGSLALRVDGAVRADSALELLAPESPNSERPPRWSDGPRAGASERGVIAVLPPALPPALLLRVMAVVPRDVFSVPRGVRVVGDSTAGLPPTTPPLTVERLKVTGLLPEGTMPFSFRRGMAVWPKLALPRVVEEAVRTTGGVFGNSER